MPATISISTFRTARGASGLVVLLALLPCLLTGCGSGPTNQRVFLTDSPRMDALDVQWRRGRAAALVTAGDMDQALDLIAKVETVEFGGVVVPHIEGYGPRRWSLSTAVVRDPVEVGGVTEPGAVEITLEMRDRTPGRVDESPETIRGLLSLRTSERLEVFEIDAFEHVLEAPDDHPRMVPDPMIEMIDWVLADRTGELLNALNTGALIDPDIEFAFDPIANEGVVVLWTGIP